MDDVRRGNFVMAPDELQFLRFKLREGSSREDNAPQEIDFQSQSEMLSSEV